MGKTSSQGIVAEGLARRIVEVIEDRNMTKTEFARETGISKSYLTEICSDQSETVPTMRIINLIAGHSDFRLRVHGWSLRAVELRAQRADLRPGGEEVHRSRLDARVWAVFLTLDFVPRIGDNSS